MKLDLKKKNRKKGLARTATFAVPVNLALSEAGSAYGDGTVSPKMHVLKP